MSYAIRCEGDKVDLGGIPTRVDGGLSKADGEARCAELTNELGELQELLYAAGDHALLVILQGMDTSGKDGTIRSVLSQTSPQGVRTVPFKQPTPLELAHDFLWRVHIHAPETGMVVVFNRSHYEAVTVERVKRLVPEAVWRARYAQINDFERLLRSSRTIVAKFYLHISAEEQRERLLARERDVSKAWKLSAGDWEERDRWDAYRAAYEDALAKCASPELPWYVVPADRKWFRNLAVAETLVDLLRPLREGWLASLRERGERELAAIQALREAEGGVGSGRQGR